MDKKAKKRIEVLRKRQEKCRQQLAGAKAQTDDPDEITKLENEISEIQAEIEKLKKGWFVTNQRAEGTRLELATGEPGTSFPMKPLTIRLPSGLNAWMIAKNFWTANRALWFDSSIEAKFRTDF